MKFLYQDQVACLFEDDEDPAGWEDHPADPLAEITQLSTDEAATMRKNALGDTPLPEVVEEETGVEANDGDGG